METLIALTALGIAIWQLKLQRDEIRLNSRVNSLIHIADLLKNRIEYHEQIIESLKTRKADWSGHARRVNNDLRPMLNKINSQLIGAVSGHVSDIEPDSVRQMLNLSGEPSAIAPTTPGSPE